MHVNIQTDSRRPWLITKLGSGLFGLDCASVTEMIRMPQVCQMPALPDYVRGVINLRGKVLPLVDLRLRLGMPSSSDDIEALCRTMAQRGQDHRSWLAELERSIQEKRAFTMARDPHQCAFGRWYDTFKSDNIVISRFLKRFDAPHQQIHRLAGEVEELARAGSVDQAQELINRAREGVLSSLLCLFDEFQQTIRENHREIAVVLSGGAGAYAVSVDAVESVERIPAAEIEKLDRKGLEGGTELVNAIVKRAHSGELVLLLGAQSILEESLAVVR